MPRKTPQTNKPFDVVVKETLAANDRKLKKAKKLFEDVAHQKSLKKNQTQGKLWDQLYKFTKSQYKELESRNSSLSTQLELLGVKPNGKGQILR